MGEEGGGPILAYKLKASGDFGLPGVAVKSNHDYSNVKVQGDPGWFLVNKARTPLGPCAGRERPTAGAGAI